MKRFGAIITSILFFLVFIPLLFLLLFAMPIEFLASSWHHLKIDSSVEGTIISSEVIRKPGKKGSAKGSAIVYSFNLGGKDYNSSRYRSGLISNSIIETGGGLFAENHNRGDKVIVYFNSSDPNFSVLERGWSKWSIGFSIVVWGMIFSRKHKNIKHKNVKILIGNSALRSLVFTGFIVLFLFPSTVNSANLGICLAIYIISVIFLCLWALLCHKKGSSMRASR